MIELIMALAASGVLATALASNLAETERFSSSGQNQILAMSIVQEQIDNARNTSYDSLASCAGSHSLLVNSSDPDYSGCHSPTCAGACRLNPRPLQLDTNSLQWSTVEATSTNGRQNLFRGTVNERVEPGPNLDTVKVTVEAVWNEANAVKRYDLSTLVAKNGINNG
jgi:type II secretory pathway pseudopilin PulG